MKKTFHQFKLQKNDSIKKKIIVALLGYLDTINHYVSSNDCVEIKKFDPDILYLNGSSNIFIYCITIIKKIKYSNSFSYDGLLIDEKYNNSNLTFFQRKKLIYLTNEIYKRSIINIAIREK